MQTMRLQPHEATDNPHTQTKRHTTCRLEEDMYSLSTSLRRHGGHISKETWELSQDILEYREWNSVCVWTVHKNHFIHLIQRTNTPGSKNQYACFIGVGRIAESLTRMVGSSLPNATRRCGYSSGTTSNLGMHTAKVSHSETQPFFSRRIHAHGFHKRLIVWLTYAQ